MPIRIAKFEDIGMSIHWDGREYTIASGAKRMMGEARPLCEDDWLRFNRAIDEHKKQQAEQKSA